LHTGCFSVASYTHRHEADPAAYAGYFKEYPEVRVCLAHMNREQPEVAWELMRRFEQLYADTSWQPAEAIRRAARAVGAERILLGSDWPLLHGDLQGDAMSVLARAVSEQDFETITETSARRFLGAAAGA
jgi:predicted TIM-barrel fold metal-dependent hydrolase